MSPKLSERYAVLCQSLGDAYSNLRKIQSTIESLNAQIDALNAAAGLLKLQAADDFLATRTKDGVKAEVVSSLPGAPNGAL